MPRQARKRPVGRNVPNAKAARVPDDDGKRKRPDPAQVTIARLRAEKWAKAHFDACDPRLRAMTVLRYIDLITGEVRENLLPPKLRNVNNLQLGRQRGHQGHPARQTRAEKRWSWLHPTEKEEHVRRINALFRRHMADNPGDGVIAGSIGVSVRYALDEDWFGLSGPEHEAALYSYLVDVIGMLLRRFDPERRPEEFLAGIFGYDEWREDCRQRHAERTPA